MQEEDEKLGLLSWETASDVIARSRLRLESKTSRMYRRRGRAPLGSVGAAGETGELVDGDEDMKEEADVEEEGGGGVTREDPEPEKQPKMPVEAMDNITTATGRDVVSFSAVDDGDGLTDDNSVAIQLTTLDCHICQKTATVMDVDGDAGAADKSIIGGHASSLVIDPFDDQSKQQQQKEEQEQQKEQERQLLLAHEADERAKAAAEAAAVKARANAWRLQCPLLPRQSPHFKIENSASAETTPLPTTIPIACSLVGSSAHEQAGNANGFKNELRNVSECVDPELPLDGTVDDDEGFNQPITCDDLLAALAHHASTHGRPGPLGRCRAGLGRGILSSQLKLPTLPSLQISSAGLEVPLLAGAGTALSQHAGVRRGGKGKLGAAVVRLSADTA